MPDLRPFQNRTLLRRLAFVFKSIVEFILLKEEKLCTGIEHLKEIGKTNNIKLLMFSGGQGFT